jgi:hypothetical protein
MPQIEGWYNQSLLVFIKDNPNGISKEELIIAKRKNKFSFSYTDLENLIKLGKVTEIDDKYFYKSSIKL